MPPQLEDGYVKIANELFEALIRFRIPGEQRQCLDFVIRKTYGFNKKEDRISNSQFVEATGLRPANVSRATKTLNDKKIVIKNDNTNPPSYRINKQYRQWRVLSKTITNKPLSKVIIPIIKSDNIKSDNNQETENELNGQCSVENQTSENSENGQNIQNDLLSKVMDTKDSNNVTKDRGTAEGGFEKQKQGPDKKTLAKLRTLSIIASGKADHSIVNEYAWVGEIEPDMIIRAKRELENLKRSISA